MLKCLYCQAEDSFVRVGIYAAAPRTLKNMNSVPSSLWGNSFSGWVLLVVESKVHRLLSRETSLWRASEVREMSQKHADYILLQVPQGSECWAKCALGFSQYRIEKKKSCHCLKHFPKLNLYWIQLLDLPFLLQRCRWAQGFSLPSGSRCLVCTRELHRWCHLWGGGKEQRRGKRGMKDKWELVGFKEMQTCWCCPWC